MSMSVEEQDKSRSQESRMGTSHHIANLLQRFRAGTNDRSYYMKCAAGGVLSAGVMHTLITPLDVVKCNMQTNSTKYKSTRDGLRIILREEGMRGLWKGWAPTLMAYSSQGALKYSLYELFKHSFSGVAGEEHAAQYRSLIYLSAGASAEMIADIFMCPWEQIKVKMQTSPKGSFPMEFGPATRYMVAHRRETGFPFGSLLPLWGRQIPYAMVKFGCFEAIVESFYTHLLTRPKDSYSASTQLGVTFAAGYLSGILCGIVSHPADTLVSLKAKPEYSGQSIGSIVQSYGLSNLFLKGLGSRILMAGTLTGLQWWTYDTFKTAMGMGTTGGDGH